VGERANGRAVVRGPRSVAGKVRCINAFQHGLSVPPILDPQMAKHADRMAGDIAKNISTPSGVDQAREVIQCVLAYHRVSVVRTNLLQNEIEKRRLENPTESESSTCLEAIASLNVLPKLAALERYERRALWRMRRAIERFRYCEWLAKNP
jgi:hypothetical protein